MNAASWVLFFFMFDPCCDMSITRFETEAQCNSAIEAFAKFANGVHKPNSKGFSVSCSKIEAGQ